MDGNGPEMKRTGPLRARVGPTFTTISAHRLLCKLQDPRKHADPVILQLKKRISYSTNDQIYVRKCYANTLSRIQSIRSAYPMSGIVLTGQPGTGALSHITLSTHGRAEIFLREKSLAALCPPSLPQSRSRAYPPLSPLDTPSDLQRHCLQAYPWTRGS